MDLSAFMKYTIPEDEADEMTRVIRKTIKSIRNKRQDAEEKQKDIIMIKNKIQKEIEEEQEEEQAPPPLITIPQALPPNLLPPIIPLPGRSSPATSAPPPPPPPPIPIQATPGPSAPPPSYVQSYANSLEASLTYNDKANLKKNNQKPLSDLTGEFIRDPSRIEEELQLTRDINQKLGPTKNGKTPAEIAVINKEIKTQQKRREKLNKILELITKNPQDNDIPEPSQQASQKPPKIKIKPKKGKGYNLGITTPLRGTLSPAPLFHRLELLTGSIVAGNNSSKVKNEFSKIVQVLHKLNFFSNADVNKLLSILYR